MLRQCHIFYTSNANHHVIRRRDIVMKGRHIDVIVRSSKTTAKDNVLVIPVYAAPEMMSCPVRALQAAMEMVPAPQDAPVFLNPETKAMITASRATDVLRAALAAVGFRGASLASFHSLRRTGVQACTQAGVPIDQVKVHGMWKSDAVKAYLPPNLRDSCNALRANLTYGH